MGGYGILYNLDILRFFPSSPFHTSLFPSYFFCLLIGFAFPLLIDNYLGSQMSNLLGRNRNLNEDNIKKEVKLLFNLPAVHILKGYVIFYTNLYLYNKNHKEVHRISNILIFQIVVSSFTLLKKE